MPRQNTAPDGTAETWRRRRRPAFYSHAMMWESVPALAQWVVSLMTPVPDEVKEIVPNIPYPRTQETR